MGITGIGSVQTYIYNSQTGKLSSKDGSPDEFVDYFNGTLSAESSATLNGYDMAKKSGIKNAVEMAFAMGSFQGIKPWVTSDTAECEITCRIVSGEEFTYTVNGDKVLTCYAPVTLSLEELEGWGKDVSFKTHQAKDYDPATNSTNLAVGDVINLGNGYQLKVGEKRVEVNGTGSGSAEDDEKVRHLEYGLNALIHFADQQWPASCIWEEHTPMLLSLLEELGIDTDREFSLNGTKCVVRDGKIEEAGNQWFIPSDAHDKALKRREGALSQLLSDRK